jgi:hypothetical protein
MGHIPAFGLRADVTGRRYVNQINGQAQFPEDGSG